MSLRQWKFQFSATWFGYWKVGGSDAPRQVIHAEQQFLGPRVLGQFAQYVAGRVRFRGVPDDA
eukprot:4225310-Lingulodinium_polyedra.AAC.1